MLPEAPGLWALDPDVLYLNHGSFGACPRAVLSYQQCLRDAMEAEAVDFLLDAWNGMTAAVAEPARMLGCRTEDTAFVENATTGVNAVLRSVDLRAGDRVITTSHAYDAVANALSWVCQRAGAHLHAAEVPFPCSGPEQVLDAVDAVLAEVLATGDRIPLAVVDHVTSKTGLILPIAEICARFAAHGIPVLIDGAHVPGHFPVDVPALGGAWYTGNLHKWAFAPKSAAILWAREDVRDQTRPLVISHGLGQGFHQEFHWQGTRDPTAWLACPAAIAFLEDLGADRLWAHNRALAHEAGQLLAEAWKVPRPAPASMCGAMVTLPLPGEVPGTADAAMGVHDQLRDQGIEVPVFAFGDRSWLRISAQAYNHLEQYETLARALS